MGSFGCATNMYSWVCLLVCLLHAAAHPCDSEVQSACPERASSELARCLKDKSEHESPTDISSECADFIALNAACADDIIKSCDEAFFTEDTALCLSTWTAREDLTPKCAGVLSWALPKQEAADGDGPNDELGMSEKDYAEKQEWRAKRRAGRSAAIEKIRQDREQEKELEALKKEDPVAYKQLMKEREEAEKSFEELKKRRRLIAAAEERKRRKELGLPELEASSEEEEEARRQKRIEERLEVIREAKKKERVNWLPYVLGGLFVAYIFFNVLNMFGGKKKDDNDEDAAVAGTNGSSKRPAPEIEQKSAKAPRSEEADEKSEVEKLLEAKKRALMEAKRAALAKLDPEANGEGREEAGETAENAKQEAVEGVADVSIVDFLRKQTEEGRGKALSEAGKRPGLVCSAPPVYVQREPKKELAAAGDAGAIVALAGPGPAPKVIPGVPSARPASKASGHWAWGGSDGGVAFVPPKRPPLNAVQAQAGAAAATLLVRPKQFSQPQMPQMPPMPKMPQMPLPQLPQMPRG